MNLHFIPECYFDTFLVKKILRINKVNHQHCCTKVESKMKAIDDFAVGIIDQDRDRNNIQYLNEFDEVIKTDSLILHKHKEKQHYIIRIAPAIEYWILNIAKETGIDLKQHGLPNDANGLKDFTKHRITDEHTATKLCSLILGSNSNSVSTLSAWLNYLFEHNRNASIEDLKKY